MMNVDKIVDEYRRLYCPNVPITNEELYPEVFKSDFFKDNYALIDKVQLLTTVSLVETRLDAHVVEQKIREEFF